MAITITFDVDADRVLASLGVMPGFVTVEAEKALLLSTHLVEAEVKALTPRRTGRLFSAWHSHVHGYTGVVSNNVSYAGFIEAGTAPHAIIAHGNGMLRFRIKGRTIFRKRVWHPGFLGRHMAKLGLDAAKPAINRLFLDAARDAVRLAIGK